MSETIITPSDVDAARALVQQRKGPWKAWMKRLSESNPNSCARQDTDVDSPKSIEKQRPE